MDTPTHLVPLSAPHTQVPLITIIGDDRAESEYGSHWKVTESKVETRPLIVYEYKNDYHKTVTMKLEMRSHLRSAIQRIMKGFLNLNLEADPLTFKKPFRPLIYHSDQIFADNPEDPDEDRALAKLRYFLSVEMTDNLQSFRISRTQNIHTYEDLWTAYTPGELAIQRYLDVAWCCQIIGCSVDRRSENWTVQCE